MAPSSLLPEFWIKLVWSFCWHYSIEHRGFAEARGDTGRVHLFIFPSERLFCELTGSWKHNNLQQSCEGESRSCDGANDHNLGFREYPIPCPTVNPSSPTQISSLGQTPPRPPSLKETEKNAIEQNAWKVKNEPTVFVLLSCWKQEHRIIVICQQNV